MSVVTFMVYRQIIRTCYQKGCSMVRKYRKINRLGEVFTEMRFTPDFVMLMALRIKCMHHTLHTYYSLLLKSYLSICVPQFYMKWEKIKVMCVFCRPACLHIHKLSYLLGYDFHSTKYGCPIIYRKWYIHCCNTMGQLQKDFCN